MINAAALLIGFIVAPLSASLIRAAIARARESGADDTGAYITGTPLALASALEKIETYAKARPMEVNPAISHLFIVNPLKGGDFLLSLFRTHPPTQERIERLNELALVPGAAICFCRRSEGGSAFTRGETRAGRLLGVAAFRSG
jgi:heat shock protein HtpX